MSRVLIVVEGPTAAGKSTLVAKLSAKYGLPVIHRAVPPSKLKDPRLVEEWFRDALLQRGPNGLILDRWVYSNGVYAPILKNQPKVPVDGCERQALAEFDRCGTIFLTSNVPTLLRRISRRDKLTMAPLRDEAALEKVVRGYEEQFNRCALLKCQLTGSSTDVYRAARTFIQETLLS
jgi:thymidylate kinase